MTKSRIANLQSLISRTICLALAISTLLVAPTKAQVGPPDRRFGAIEAFRDHEAAIEAGVGWERILFYWSELQREGPDEWNGYHVPDEWLNQAAAADREVVAVLKHTPAWATDGPAGCGVPRGLDLPVDDPGNLWAAFVRRAVEIYRGRIKHWIIWNEPDIAPGEYGAEWCGSIEEYYQLLKVAYLVAHEVDPDAVIHLAGLTYFHDTVHGRSYYLERFLDVATTDPTGQEHGYHFDVVSLHIYFEIANFDTILGETRAALAAHGLDKSIWVNETDAPPNDDPQYPLPESNYKVSLEEQASFLLQAFSLALSEGAERIAVYKWVVADPPLPGAEPNGVVRADGSRRPAFDAYDLITTHYAGTVSASEDRQPLYSVITLERGTLTTRVLWTRTQAEATVSLPALSGQARLIDQTGTEQTVTPVDGQYTITLPGARCADKRGCIIGGFTYLLIEDGATPVQTAIPTAVIPTETPTPAPTDPPALTDAPPPTDTPTSTITPTPTPTATPTPTSTFTPLPVFTATPLPTQTPRPTFKPTPPSLATPSPEVSAWPLLIGLAAVFLLAAIIGSIFKYRE